MREISSFALKKEKTPLRNYTLTILSECEALIQASTFSGWTNSISRGHHHYKTLSKCILQFVRTIGLEESLDRAAVTTDAHKNDLQCDLSKNNKVLNFTLNFDTFMSRTS